FGEGDPLVLTVSLAVIGLALLIVCARMAGSSPGGRFVAATTGAVALWFVSQPAVSQYVELGLSEYLTWAALPAALALVFLDRTRWALVTGAALLALSGITRSNQLPGIAVVFAALGIRAWRSARRVDLVISAAVAGAILLLPLVHNLVYGGQFVLLTR